jgi:hypothetical protein
MPVGTLKELKIISIAFEIRLCRIKKEEDDWDNAVLTAHWFDWILFQICQKECSGGMNACKVEKSIDQNDLKKSYRFIG